MCRLREEGFGKGGGEKRRKSCSRSSNSAMASSPGPKEGKDERTTKTLQLRRTRGGKKGGSIHSSRQPLRKQEAKAEGGNKKAKPSLQSQRGTAPPCCLGHLGRKTGLSDLELGEPAKQRGGGKDESPVG